MELNWSTFILEIINFLVLVWILKRFLYRPVLLILEKRHKEIENSLSEAHNQHAEAVALEKKYKERLDKWEHEKQQLKESLLQELQNEKTQKLENIKFDIESEREKARVIEQRHETEKLRQYQLKAHEQGARFIAKLLNAITSEELESHLINLLLNTFDDMPEEKIQSLRAAYKTSADGVTITSAFPINETQQQQLTEKISSLLQQPVNINYLNDKKLLAGLRIIIGAWILRVNLQDELTGFIELIHEY